MLEKNLQISIHGNPDASIAEMMQAYLWFYLQGNCVIHLQEKRIQIAHPLALQVMQEDGIEIREFYVPQQQTTQPPEIKIFYTQQNVRDSAALTISDPLEALSYDTILQNFRMAREEVKKASIEIAGKILQQA
jgi:hypothetical protein